MIKRWTKEELHFLKNKGKDFSLEKLSKKLNRSVNSILKKSSKENISLRLNFWSQKDIIFLKNNLGIIPCKIIASKLNKTISSVYHKASRLNIKGRYFEYKDRIKDFNKLCKYCGKPITLKKVHQYSKMFNKVYCSRRCATLGTGRSFKKGQISWNKGIKYSSERKKEMSLQMKKIYRERPELLKLFNKQKKGRLSKLKGKTLEQIHGKEKAEEIKQKLREKTLEMYMSGTFPKQTHTKPEMIMKKEFIKMGCIEGIDFIHQKKMFDKFFCDFVFPKQKIVIEVQGDYWHANPMFFPYNPDKPEEDLNPVQVKGIKRDKSKEGYIRKRGWNFIPIWEYDINNNLHIISKVLKKIIGTP